MRQLALLKTPFPLRSLMLKPKTDRLLIDVVRGHCVAPDSALVGLNRTGFIGGLILREDGAHATTHKYSPELRERAVRMA